MNWPIAAPKFAEYYYAGKMEDLFHVAHKSARLIFWATSPILVVLVFLGHPIMKFVFGTEFTVAYPAMLVLVAGQFVNAVSGSTGIFMNMTGRQAAFRNIMTASAVLNVLLCLALVPRFGTLGAACSGALCLVTWNLVTLYYIKSRHGIGIGYFPGKSLMRKVFAK